MNLRYTKQPKSWGVDPKAEMYKLPAMYVGAYAERDAQLTLELWQELKKEILHQDIQRPYSKWKWNYFHV